MSATKTKQCPACDKSMAANRGVCPECGHQSTWFKFRLYFGCAGALFAFIIILIMTINVIFGAAP